VRSGKQNGMTLVEVLIATTILSLIMFAAVTAFSAFSKAYGRLQGLNHETAILREVSHFLRRGITDAVKVDGRFTGDATSLSWLTALDRAGSAGGLQFVKLFLSEGILMLAFAPFDPQLEQGEEPAWGTEVEDFPLAEGTSSLNLSYLVSPEDGWVDVISSDDLELGFPLAVEVQIARGGKPWPPIIVALEK